MGLPGSLVSPAIGLVFPSQLRVSRVTLSRLIHGKAGISPDMALRLEAWLDGPSAEAWLHMQTEYDLWQARQQPRPTIERVAA